MSGEVANSVEMCEDALSQFAQNRKATIDAFESTINGGRNLLEQLRFVGSLLISHARARVVCVCVCVNECMIEEWINVQIQ